MSATSSLPVEFSKYYKPGGPVRKLARRPVFLYNDAGHAIHLFEGQAIKEICFDTMQLLPAALQHRPRTKNRFLLRG